MTGDLMDFYLETPMDRYEYIRIPISVIPDFIIKLYNLDDIAKNGFVYAEVRKGMYGFPQSGRIAHDRFKKFLEPHGYEPMPITPGLWRHKQSNLIFMLVVDNFGVSYTHKDDAIQLMTTLKKMYKVSED